MICDSYQTAVECHKRYMQTDYDCRNFDGLYTEIVAKFIEINYPGYIACLNDGHRSYEERWTLLKCYLEQYRYFIEILKPEIIDFCRKQVEVMNGYKIQPPMDVPK